MIDYSLSISTFMIREKFDIRFSFFKECIDSLLNTNFEGKIYIVDDGSETKDHLLWTKNKKDHRIIIIEKFNNTGVAKTKNTGIKHIFSDSEIYKGFLSDDDMIFKDKDWHIQYLNAYNKTKIDHFSYAIPSMAAQGNIVKINDYGILRTPGVNGCLLFITRELVKKIGYFKVFPYKYGHEHSNYSLRAVRTIDNAFYDIIDSNNYIEVNKGSHGKTSINIDMPQMQHNEKLIHDSELFKKFEE